MGNTRLVASIDAIAENGGSKRRNGGDPVFSYVMRKRGLGELSTPCPSQMDPRLLDMLSEPHTRHWPTLRICGGLPTGCALGAMVVASH